ncbi:MAG: hypothetical protein JRC86_01975 [Deltaproteobacteria bacterium]|nr:hypothetical protein [Deltaproteobacteria bacterium]
MSEQSVQGTYVGERKELLGEHAILIQEDDEHVRAQFDNLKLGTELTHSWTVFPETDFEIDPPVD